MATSLNETSGTVGQTVLDVVDIIEHAVRRCGVSASIITAEQLRSARVNLFLILSNLATKGLSLWCVQRFTFGIQAGVLEYALPVGTVDTLKILYRTSTSYPSDTFAAGRVSVTLPTETIISSAVVTPSAEGTYELVLEGSADGLAWYALGGPQLVEFTGKYPVGLDAQKLVAYRFWRVSDNRDPTRTLLSATFMTNVAEYQMSKMSRDDYAQLPNKASQSQWPLQFWYNKQFYRPTITVWPVPQVDAGVSAASGARPRRVHQRGRGSAALAGCSDRDARAARVPRATEGVG